MNTPFPIWQEPLCTAAAALSFWLPAVNIGSFLLFGLDKARAKRQKFRIPEHTLFLLSILGGSIGALAGMQLWKHKTRHNAFRIGIPAILLLQSTAALWLLTCLPVS